MTNYDGASSRLTNAQKTLYRIALSGESWAGQCPDCNTAIYAPDASWPQVAVAHAIEEHRTIARLSSHAAIRVMHAQTVTRFVITHVQADGRRTLSEPMQGRCTYETAAVAEIQRAAMLANNSAERLREVFGEQFIETVAVRPVACYVMRDGALGDPKTCWFAS